MRPLVWSALIALVLPWSASALSPAALLQAGDTVVVVDTIVADTVTADTIPADERRGRRYEDVIPPTAESHEGLFTVHKVDDSYYFEIPLALLGREILLQTRITQAPTGVGYGGQEESSAVIRLERRDDRILMRMAGHQNVAADSLPIFEAVRNANFEPILQSFEIRTMPADSSAVVIDVSSFFRSDTPIIGLRQSRRDQYQIRGLNSDRTFIESMRSFPENIEVRRTMTYSAGRPPSNQIGGTLSMELGHSLVLLPEVPMTPRAWDERVGYFSVTQNDFGTDAQRLVQQRYIQRWRLEPSDPAAYARGQLVEPVRPIVIYIDPATPERWRPYLKQGIEDWQEAFEAAGFRNAILAKDPPTREEDPTFDPADARVSMIRYLASPVQNASGPRFYDPRSGEILGTHIQWHHNVMNLVRNWYFVQTAAANSEARGVEFDDEVMGQLIRYVAAHEVGHTLGLPHNMKGHSAIPVDSLRTRWVCENGTSTSIMDYARFNYVAQPGDDTCFIPRIGPYDRWAIEWGYRVIPDAPTPEAQRVVLNRWILEQGNGPLFQFCDPSAMDPGSTQEALGDDPVRASDYGVQNLRRITENLREWTFQEGESYAQLEELYSQIVGQWNRYVAHVTLLIGGVDWTRMAQGQDGRPFTPVPSERQRAAIEYLDRQVFQTPEWMIDPEILYRIEGSGIQDRIRARQVSALNQVLNVDRMKRMIEQEALMGRDAYPLGEMLTDLRRSVWRELEGAAVIADGGGVADGGGAVEGGGIDGAGGIDAFRRNLQRGHLNRLESLLESDEVRSTDIAPLVRGQLRALQRDAGAASEATADEITRLHLEDVLRRIERILEG